MSVSLPELHDSHLEIVDNKKNQRALVILFRIRHERS